MKNSVILIGRLGAAPTIKDVTGGRKVAQLSVTTWESYFNPNKNGGEWETINEWHRVVAWGDQCDRIQKLKTGSLVLVEGKITTRKYTDSNNVERYTTEIVGHVKAMPNPQGKQATEGEKDSGPERETERRSVEPSDDLPF